MSCQVHVGILDSNGKLTKEAKENFVSQVLVLLKYGTENAPESERSPIPYDEKLAPDPAYAEYLSQDTSYLKDEKVYAGFYQTWVARYEKIANDLNFPSNFGLLPAVADPIAIASSGFNVEIPSPDFPAGFTPYFTGALPQTLIGDLVDSGDDETKTKFLAPTALLELVKTLLEKNAPPAPKPPELPKIDPPPLPEDFSLPASSTSPTIEQLSISYEKPAADILGDLSSKEFAAYEKLPQVLSDTISKIPDFITKIANPTEIVSGISKTVKNSGMLGPESEETSTVEKAAKAVLSQKIAEMTFVAAMGITIGSAPGSVTTSITQKTSSKKPEIRYKPVPREEPEEPPKLTPAEKAYQRATGLNESYYGNPDEEGPERTRYLEGLFYVESAYKSYPENYLNMFGERATGTVQDRDNFFQRFNGKPDIRDNDIAEEASKLPIISKTGFFDWQSYSAEKLSSCAMFVRSCFYAAGASNRFFLGLFAPGTAVSVLNQIGLMRNYRWVAEDYENYDFSATNERAIINDLYKYNENKEIIDRDVNEVIPNVVVDGKPATVGSFKQKLEQYVGNVPRYQRNPAKGLQDPAVANFMGDWSLQVDQQGNITTSENLKFLKPYLKPEEKRAVIQGFDMGRFVKTPEKFPALDKGDAMLIVRTMQNVKGKPAMENGEHVLLVSTPRPEGFKYVKSNKDNNYVLQNPIKGIEGGSIDDDNLVVLPNPRSLTYKSFDSIHGVLLAAKSNPIPDSLKDYVELASAAPLSDDDINKIQAAFTNKNVNAAAGSKLADIVKLVEDEVVAVLNVKVRRGRPSAILPTNHDLGYHEPDKLTPSSGWPPQNPVNNENGPGFFLGATIIARTKNLNNNSDVQSMIPISEPASSRRILAIFKTNNYCNEAENTSPFAYFALKYMDDIEINNVTKYFNIKINRYFLAHRVFPSKFYFVAPKKEKIGGLTVDANGKQNQLADDTP